MKRFENAKVGDEVYCRIEGKGVITEREPSSKCDPQPIMVRFDVYNCSYWYFLDGKQEEEHAEPTLFYREGENLYLTERPIKPVDWSKIPSGTQILVSDSEKGWFKREFVCEYKGVFAVFVDHCVVSYRHAKLVED